jgi:hypothetical protein
MLTGEFESPAGIHSGKALRVSTVLIRRHKMVRFHLPEPILTRARLAVSRRSHKPHRPVQLRRPQPIRGISDSGSTDGLQPSSRSSILRSSTNFGLLAQMVEHWFEAPDTRIRAPHSPPGVTVAHAVEREAVNLQEWIQVPPVTPLRGVRSAARTQPFEGCYLGSSPRLPSIAG